MTTRRAFLISIAALPLAACEGGPLDDDDSAEPDEDDSSVSDDDDSGDSTPEPPPPFPIEGSLEPGSFPSAIQVCDALPDSVLVAFRTMEPDVHLVLGKADPLGDVLVWESPLLPVPDGILNLEVTDLEADTSYLLYAIDPARTRRSDVVQFRTALAPGTSRPLRIAASSCFGRSGAPWQSLRQTTQGNPDLCLLLGDTVYADGAETLEEYRGFWDEALSTDGLYYASLATSFVATWDDHEVDNNWTWSGAADRFPAALASFREAFPQRPGPAEERVYRTLRWGDAVEVISLDCRADRGDGRYISQEQMDWLKNILTTSTARFKLILNSVPIIDFSDWIGGISADDRWQGTPEQRTDLLSFLEDEGIEGVLFLSGDMHFGSVCQVSGDGEVGSGHWEVMAGPAGSTINPMAYLPPSWTDQYDLVIASWNSVLLDLDPSTGEVGVTFLDDEGSVIGERLLSL